MGSVNQEHRRHPFKSKSAKSYWTFKIPTFWYYHICPKEKVHASQFTRPRFCHFVFSKSMVNGRLAKYACWFIINNGDNICACFSTQDNDQIGSYTPPTFIHISVILYCVFFTRFYYFLNTCCVEHFLAFLVVSIYLFSHTNDNSCLQNYIQIFCTQFFPKWNHDLELPGSMLR